MIVITKQLYQIFGVRRLSRAAYRQVADADSLKAVVKYVEDYGNRYGVYLDISGTEIIALLEEEVPSFGTTVFIHPNFDKVHFFRKDNECSIGYPEMLTQNTEQKAG